VIRDLELETRFQLSQLSYPSPCDKTDCGDRHWSLYIVVPWGKQDGGPECAVRSGRGAADKALDHNMVDKTMYSTCVIRLTVCLSVSDGYFTSPSRRNADYTVRRMDFCCGTTAGDPTAVPPGFNLPRSTSMDNKKYFRLWPI